MMTPLEALQQFCPEQQPLDVEQEPPAVLKQREPAPQLSVTSGDETSTASPDFSDNEDDEDDKAPNNFICPLTLQVMRDPVLSRYGQNYERHAIIEWLTSSNGRGSCPLTRRPLELRGLVSNHNLRCQIRQWQLAQPQQQPHDDIQLDDDDEPNAAARCGVYGSSYYLLDWNDEAQHAEEDPPLILEYRREEAAPASSAGRQRRRGFLGRLRRAVGASRAGA